MRIGFFLGKGIATPHIVKASAKALQKIGERVRFIYLEKEKQSIVNFINEFSPDFIIAVDHKGIDDEEMLKYKIPYISWFVDNPLYFVSSENFNAYHYAAVTDRSFIPILNEMGCKKVFYLPLAGDIEIFNFSKDHFINIFDINLCYVGSFSGLLKKLKDKRKKQFSLYINKICDEAFSIKVKKTELSLIETFVEVEKKIGIEFIKKIGINNLGTLCYILDLEVDAYNKMEIYNELMSYDFHVYGSKDWKELPNSEIFYKGEIIYGKELFTLYKKVKVNIILTRPQILNGVNQRIYDIPLSGGFFLSDYRDEVKNIFPDVWENIIFKNYEDLHNKIKYYLTNSSKRLEIIDYCSKKIRESHSYDVRMQYLVCKMTDILKYV